MIKFDIEDFLNMSNDDIMKKNGGKRFDIVLMNPPYEGKVGLHLKFLNKVCKIAYKVISIQPSTWIISNNTGGFGLKELYKNVRNILNTNYAEIESVNALKYFGTGSLGELSINYIDSEKHHDIIFNGSHYDDVKDISYYSNDKVLLNIREKIYEKVNELDNCWNHIKYDSNKNPHTLSDKIEDPSKLKGYKFFYFQEMRGHKDKNGIYNDDFFTYISNNDKYNQLVDYDPNRTKCYFKFKDNADGIKEFTGFKNFLKTDFARIILWFDKVNGGGNNLTKLPWLDFKDNNFQKSIIEVNNYLMKTFNITNNELIKIQSILPDYYGIRK